MSRKVLGDDPFAGAAPRASRPSKAPSKVPAKTPSRAPAKTSRPSKPAARSTPAAPPSDVAVEAVAVTETRGETPAMVETVVETTMHIKTDAGAAVIVEAPSEAAPSVEVRAGEMPPPPMVETSTVPSLDAILEALRGDPTLLAQVRAALPAEHATEPARPEPSHALAINESSPPGGDAPEDGAMLQSDFYRQHWGRIAMRDRSEISDDFGLDPAYEARWRPTWDFLYDRWWRVDVEGIHHVPAEGAATLVANHGGAIPFDGVMLSTALRREHPAQRQLRWLAEDFVFHMPFAGAFVNRIGAVRACQENAERLIRQGNVVALFPEGVKGIGKLYRDRYKLQRFGRGGHIKLAIRTRAPIIPVTIVGNEDTHPMLAGSDRLAKLLGVPYVPITPTFPWLGPAGLLPLPAKWRIIFGEPIPVAHLPPEAADDELLVGKLNEKLRATIQETLDRALRERRSVFKG